MNGVFEIYIETHFSAAHALRGYHGDCARLHGHNWIIRVYIRCRELDDIGIGIDFRIIKENVKDVLQKLDHANINELPAFQSINPTSENLAQYLYRELSKRLNSDRAAVSKVRVSETSSTGAFYWEE